MDVEKVSKKIVDKAFDKFKHLKNVLLNNELEYKIILDSGNIYFKSKSNMSDDILIDIHNTSFKLSNSLMTINIYQYWHSENSYCSKGVIIDFNALKVYDQIAYEEFEKHLMTLEKFKVLDNSPSDINFENISNMYDIIDEYFIGA